MKKLFLVFVLILLIGCVGSKMRGGPQADVDVSDHPEISQQIETTEPEPIPEPEIEPEPDPKPDPCDKGGKHGRGRGRGRK